MRLGLVGIRRISTPDLAYMQETLGRFARVRNSRLSWDESRRLLILVAEFEGGSQPEAWDFACGTLNNVALAAIRQEGDWHAVSLHEGSPYERESGTS